MAQTFFHIAKTHRFHYCAHNYKDFFEILSVLEKKILSISNIFLPKLSEKNS